MKPALPNDTAKLPPESAAPPPAEPANSPLTRPVRVLIVDTASAFGGTLVVSRNLLKHLDPRHVEASLVSACKDGFVTPGFAGAAPVRLLAPRLDYVTMGRWKSAIHRRVRWATLRRGLEIVAIVTELIANIPYLLRLIKLYRDLDVDIVHVNNYTMEPMWAARLLGIPIVYHLHGLVSPPIERSAWRNFQRVTAFISISRVVTESAVRAGIDRSRIHEIPNFVDELPSGPPPPLPDTPAIGIFGRVTSWKGQKEFLRAAIQLLPAFPNLRVYVVGDASDSDQSYFDECREIARASDYPDNFVFTGRVSDVASLYRKCTVVVHASTLPEPFGMVLIEAMAEARPVVASMHGAASEIIRDGVEGRLVDPTDSHSMTSAIAALLVDPQRAVELGRKGRDTVRAMYVSNIVPKRFEQLYWYVAQPKRPPR